MLESKVPTRIDVINRIKEWIDNGDLLPGGQIPPERELTKRLSSQRLTIRNALAALEQEGVVRRIGPRTRVVAERTRIMENSFALIGSNKLQWLLDRMHMPGWAVMMSVGAMAEISTVGMNMLVIHSDRTMESELQRLIAGRPNGVVFPEHFSEFPGLGNWLTRLTEAGIPVAIYGSDPSVAQYDHVCSDHAVGSYKLTRHLIEQGRKQPLMIYAASSQKYWVKDRRAGYEKAMHEAGLEPLPFVWTHPVPEVAPAGTAEQFDSERRHALSYLVDYLGPLAGKIKADALMVASDGDIYGMAAACRSVGVDPSSEVLITGYDNYWVETWERQYEPFTPYATVDKLNSEAGRMMVRMLCDRVAGKLPAGPYRSVIEPELILV